MRSKEEFKQLVESDILKNPDGILIFDISIRYGSIESDIISVAELYGFDPKWSEVDQRIINNEPNPDNFIEDIYYVSEKAESYLNDLLEEVGIKGWMFVRNSEGELWGLFPFSVIDEWCM